MTLLLIALSTVCAGVPMFSFLALIWWLDRYDREPVPVLLLTFMWGAIGAIMSAMIISVLAQAGVHAGLAAASVALSADLTGLTDTLSPVLIAPIVEEPSKAIILLAIIWSKHFDNMTDGFVYGAAAGLGFGMTENFLYFVSASGELDQWLGTVFIRTFYSAVMHATATAIVGAALGWGRFRGNLVTLVSGSIGLLMAMAVHALWNGLLTADMLGLHGSWVLDLILLPLEVLVTFVVFEICVLDESHTIKLELSEEVEQGHLPAEHPKILASWWLRRGRSWLAPGIDKDTYIETATVLAMRKRQMHLLQESDDSFYGREVYRLRRKLRGLLSDAGQAPSR